MVHGDSSAPPSHPLIETDRIEGTAGYDASGTRIETIQRLVIEKVSGHVVYAVTSFGGFLGLGAETHTIPWDQLRYDTTVEGYKTASRRTSCAARLSSPVVMTLSYQDTRERNSVGTT